MNAAPRPAAVNGSTERICTRSVPFLHSARRKNSPSPFARTVTVPLPFTTQSAMLVTIPVMFVTRYSIFPAMSAFAGKISVLTVISRRSGVNSSESASSSTLRAGTSSLLPHSVGANSSFSPQETPGSC